MILGASVVLFGFFGFTTWAALAPLKSAVVAPGVVAVESKRRVIQHLEGGIVAEIAAHDGQLVKEGDLLLRIDDTQSGARRSQLDARRIAAGVERARLEAELAEASELILDPELGNRQLEPVIANALALQRELLASRRGDRSQRRAVFARQIEQIIEEIKGLNAQLASRDKKRALNEERLAGLRQLAAKGYASRVQVGALESELAAIEGESGDLIARVSAAQQKIEQLREQTLSFDSSVKAEIADRLQATRREFAEAHEALMAAEDIKRRTDVRSPIAGTVVTPKVHNVGEVVSPGAPLMEIVPSEDNLVVELNINTDDIDAVHPGLPVQVRFSAYSFRTTPAITGTLTQLSADRLVDSRTGLATYPARAVLRKDSLAAARRVQLYPGMTAEVVIVKGERTLLDYMLDPILRATEHALTED
jgi:HlyD family type I secretion membrane fusion protein